MFNIDEFANPGYLYLLFLTIPLITWYVWKQKGFNAPMQFSTIQGFEKASVSYKIFLKHLVFVFRVIVIILLIIVLARPQSSESWENKTTKGIDVVLAMDISSSMLAQDFNPDRLEASKDVAIEFISGRPDDRMGLVVFSGESFTQCPLTT